MAGNIALEKSGQSSFTKAVKTILKKNETKAKEQSRKKGHGGKIRTEVLGKVPKSHIPSKPLGRGVVYLSHIPKGFYEKEMLSYFKQFGRVTRLKLARSKVTGNSKGYAFIEFLYSEVAQVVAETMNNYLMCGKLLKAEYIPGDMVGRGMFDRKITPENNPRKQTQRKWIKKTNKVLTDQEVTELAEHELKRLDKLKKKMEEAGIEFDFEVDDIPLENKNSPVNGQAVLEVDDSDDEIEFKVHPNVKKVLKRKKSPGLKSSNNKKSKVNTTDKFDNVQILSTPEKKRMSLLQGLKSKSSPSPEKQSPTSKIGTALEKYKNGLSPGKKSATKQTQQPSVSPGIRKTPILQLKRFDQLSPKKSLLKSSKEANISSPNGTNTLTPKKSSQKLKLASGSSKKVKLSPKPVTPALDSKKPRSPSGKTEKENILQTSSLRKQKKTPKADSKSKNEAPVVSSKKVIPTPDTGKKTKTPINSEHKSKGTQPTADSLKKKKSPSSIAKKLTFTSSSKKSNIPRPLKVKSPK